MNSFDYVVAIQSVLLGLALGQSANSINKLVQHREDVWWHPLPLLALLYASVLAFGMYFDLWYGQHRPELRQFYFSGMIVAQFVLLFVLVSSALPMDPSRDWDLGRYYDVNRSYFWTLALVFQVSYAGVWIYFQATQPFATLEDWTFIGVSIGVPLILRFVASRRIHYLGLALLIADTLYHRGKFVLVDMS